jgi:ribosomal protein S18 acetylase RimI-like enzyme
MIKAGLEEMMIRPAAPGDFDAIWGILEPVIRAGETYALPQEMSKAEALAYWMAPDRQSFVTELGGEILGTYYLRPNQAGGGAHVANCGYVTHPAANGRGIARKMCEHSLQYARALGYRAMQFNFVLESNARAVGLWRSLGFETIGRIPEGFLHPQAGYVDALVMFRVL